MHNRLALKSFRAQYPRVIEVREHRGEIHDRALLVDDRDFYSLGASIKHAGNKLWILNKLEDAGEISALRTKITEYWNSATPL